MKKWLIIFVVGLISFGVAAILLNAELAMLPLWGLAAIVFGAYWGGYGAGRYDQLRSPELHSAVKRFWSQH